MQERASYKGREDDNEVLSPRADDGSVRSKEGRAVDVRIDSAAGAPPIQMVKRAKVRWTRGVLLWEMEAKWAAGLCTAKNRRQTTLGWTRGR